jgi:putative oxidoreductase
MSTITGDQTAFDRERAQSAVHAVDVGLVVLRLALGIIFIAHGAQKLFGWFGGQGLEATVTGFGSMGIPTALSYVAAFTEFFGGIAVIIGLLSRLASLGLAINMLVAMALVHAKNGFFMNSPGGAGIEFTLALFAMALTILIAGPGRIAISDAESRPFRHPSPNP